MSYPANDPVARFVGHGHGIRFNVNPRWAMLLALFATLCCPFVADAAEEAPGVPETRQVEGKQKRVREGTQIEATGYFRATGDRVTFYSEGGKTRYRSLENLTLERISRAIEDNPGQLEWTVSGLATEYRGAKLSADHLRGSEDDPQSSDEVAGGPSEKLARQGLGPIASYRSVAKI